MKSFAIGYAIATFLISASASAQSSDVHSIAGSWQLLSWEQRQKDGSVIRSFGETPKGVHELTREGRFFFMAARPDLPKNKSPNRRDTTDEENRRIVDGTLAAFGTYKFDPQNNTLSLLTEASTYPNQVGQGSRKVTKLTGEELEYTNDSAGGLNVFKFRRAK